MNQSSRGALPRGTPTGRPHPERSPRKAGVLSFPPAPCRAESNLMPTLFVTSRAGEEMAIDAEVDRSVMEAIRDGAFDELLALCGGCCSCATCHVYVEDGHGEHLPPVSGDEDALLDGSSHRRPNSRLSCQIAVQIGLDGLRVRIAPEE